MREQRQLLQMRGVLAPQNGKLIFTQDFRFSSPSTAAGVLVGGSANGRLAWKDLNGVTLKSLQDARLGKDLVTANCDKSCRHNREHYTNYRGAAELLLSYN
ncbi:DUF4357 domain-containing protein [Vreelandella hamiltonii]|uniref:DUF4357 domain-containing protein n=1 Tax=Vreelandella hamiltonii TaxID=502829 RepID=UPI00357164E1